MATQTFTVTNRHGTQERYEPRRVNYKGVSGHIWKRSILAHGCWILEGQLYQDIKATRKQIAEAWWHDKNLEDIEMADCEQNEFD